MKAYLGRFPGTPGSDVPTWCCVGGFQRLERRCKRWFTCGRGDSFVVSTTRVHECGRYLATTRGCHGRLSLLHGRLWTNYPKHCTDSRTVQIFATGESSPTQPLGALLDTAACFKERNWIMPTFTKVGLEALLTPENCAVLLIDHQPSQLANVNDLSGLPVMRSPVVSRESARRRGGQSCESTRLSPAP